MTLPSYAEWLTPSRLKVEEEKWADSELRTWPIFVNWINWVLQDKNVLSMIEFGCGTGWVAKAMPPDLNYVGVDANPHCLAMAMEKNPGRWFARDDIRIKQLHTFDLSCAFSVLKHFGLHEWDEVVGNVVGAGMVSLFSMPVGPEEKDDGTEFPHVWVTPAHLQEAVLAAGHIVVRLEPIATGEHMVLTAKC